MSDLHYLIDADRVPVGEARPAKADGRWFAVCNDNGSFHVADVECPHEGGPMGRGDVKDGCLICPVHHWPWDLTTGMTDENLPHLRLARYRCEVRDGKVYADLSAPLPPKL
jgi:nitrite reductase/ring-hydroxylating ferredoxin subunit